MTPEETRLSKRMSYVLRRNPADLGLSLDTGGWIDFDEFVTALQRRSSSAISRDLIVDVIENNDKQRFELVDRRIRAAQGHSVMVDLELNPLTPPDRLWHGTVNRFIPSILENGLLPSGRTHVHLSDSIVTARDVGSRRGTPVILQIDAARMHQAGVLFYQSANGVWLTDAVAPPFLTVVESTH